MSRKKKPRMEYRYYEAPEKCPVLALLGEKMGTELRLSD